MVETRHELSNYRDIYKVSERFKRPEVKKDVKNRTRDAHIQETRELQ